MKLIRYIVGAVGFLLVWGFVAAAVNVLVTFFISPGHHDFAGPGLGWNWRDLPGHLLGLFAGIQSFRASVRVPQEKSSKAIQGFTWMLALIAFLLFVFVGCYLYLYL